MQHCGSTWKDRTGFLGTVAHRDHVVELLIKIRVDPFGHMVGNIDINLLHDRNGIWIEPDGMRPSTHNIKLMSREVAKPSFCHLAPTGITGTEKEHLLFHWGHLGSKPPL